MHKPVAVILLNWNTPQYTADCVASLNKYCDKAGFDIIIADNGSTDGSLNILSTQFPDAIFIDNKENLGFAEGNNRGLQYSIDQGYTYSLVINNDTVVDEDIITKLINHLDLHTEAAAVQPAIFWMHNRAKLWNGPGYFNKLLGETQSKKEDSLQLLTSFIKAEWVTGCCMLIRNSALKLSGLFNKQFFLYYEDVELSYRLRQTGHELHYLPTAKIYHEAGASGKTKTAGKEGFLSPVIHYYVCRNHFWFLRRYGKSVFYPINLIYKGAYYLALLLYFIIRRRNQKASFLLKGLKEGIFTPQSVIWPNN